MKTLCALTICCILGIESPQELAAPLDAPSPAARFLEQNPGYRSHHEGYQRFLDGHPEVAQAERAWTGLLASERFRPLVQDFEDALERDSEAVGKFDAFYDTALQNPALLSSIASLQPLPQPSPTPQSGTNLQADLLRRQSQILGSFGESTEEEEDAPGSISSLLSAAQQNPEISAQLQSIAQPSAMPNAGPAQAWWSLVLQLDARGGGAYRRLASYFIQTPTDFQCWHQRNLALSKQPHARSWIRYWHALVRENPELKNTYYTFLKQGGSIQSASSGSLVARIRAIQESPWPPESLPPAAANPIQKMERQPPARPWSESRDPLPVRPQMPQRPAPPAMRTRDDLNKATGILQQEF